MRYLDTSVLVAYYVPEPLSARAQSSLQREPAPAISELVELEFFAALSPRLRVGDLERGAVDRVATLFLEGDFSTRFHLQAGHYRLTRDIIGRSDLPLTSPDALHLALVAAERLTLVTADHQLAANAGALGLARELLCA